MVKQNKKSIREVFDFFPNAQWITQDKGRNGAVCLHMNEPEIEFAIWGPAKHWDSCGSSQSLIDNRILGIHWGNRRTWKQRIVSRSEAENE